ncbi:VOC family protein, partial [Streptomyces prasinus]|uniref:VOC family protein n=1 Tax=Streptomyces prasinus TaxID=67345 RepID=UPI003629829A
MKRTPTRSGCILKVPEPKTAKNRLHIDVLVTGHGSSDERWARIKAESERLVRAGGTVLERFDGHHVLMADPEGKELWGGAPTACGVVRDKTR